MKNISIAQKILFGLATLLMVGIIIGVIFANNSPQVTSNKIQVVAGENFWGSLVGQIGGDKIHVTSVVSDPNADPHEYETTNADARAFASAKYVVLNGAGYDSWGDKLLNANPNSTRRVLRVADLIGKKDGDNPHFWYSPAYVNQVVDRVAYDLETIDPTDKSYFEAQLENTHQSLTSYQNEIAAIKHQYGGLKVAATEDIFAYLANAAGLDLISPPNFIEAVAEGNDPSAQAVAQFQQQLQSKVAKVLVYNLQTVTPLTTSVQKLASDEGIPVIGITETLHPLGASFQAWMGSEIMNLQKALNLAAQAR